MLFSILCVLFYFSTALLVLHVATLQLRKYSFLNYKKPVLDPWSYLQPPGTLGEKISSQNSQDGYQGNVQWCWLLRMAETVVAVFDIF